MLLRVGSSDLITNSNRSEGAIYSVHHLQANHGKRFEAKTSNTNMT